MSDAREEVLGRIRRALRRDPVDAELAARLERRIEQPPIGVVPQWGEASRDRFLARLEAAAASFESLADISQVPARVAAYLEANALDGAIAVAPVLGSLNWPDTLDVHRGPVRGEHAVSVTPCYVAVAETGSVVLVSDTDTPTSLNFLPDDHLVVVLAEQIVDHLEDAWRRLREWPRFPPRSVNFITGPSRTADVEQTIQLGAHGPRRLHVLLVEA